MIESEIAIIGAGPAGSTAALFLGKLGIPCVIIDRDDFPRDKICGDCLGGYVISILKQLGDDIFERFVSFTQKSEGMGVHFFSPSLLQLSIPATRLVNNTIREISLSRRQDFDHFLFREVQKRPEVKIYTGIELTGFSRENNKLILHSRNGNPVVSTRMAIMATGSQSKISNSISNFRVDKKHLAGGVRSYYENLEVLGSEMYIEFYFLKELLPGYLWIFPINRTLFNVGIGMRSDIIAKRKIDLKKMLPGLIASYPFLSKRFEKANRITPPEGFPLALGPARKRISGDNFLLAGDSASLIEPFFGEGIGNAMVSGKIAAEHIVQCMQKNDFSASFNRNYDKQVFQKLGGALKLSTMLQKAAFQPWLIDRVFKNIMQKPSLHSLLSKTINGDLAREPMLGIEFLTRSIIGY